MPQRGAHRARLAKRRRNRRRRRARLINDFNAWLRRVAGERWQLDVWAKPIPTSRLPMPVPPSPNVDQLKTVPLCRARA